MTNENKEEKTLKPDSDELWGQVEYVYSSYAQLTASNKDVRILFADELPPDGKARPVAGIIMSHIQAASFAAAMSQMIQKISSASDPMVEEETHK